MDDLTVRAAGRTIPGALDRIRRYCGLWWSGGRPETWAWHYYDEVPTSADNVVTPMDVVCASAVHPGLSREDLEAFRSLASDLTEWLAAVPTDVALWSADDSLLTHLAGISDDFSQVSTVLLSKVLHRKRPHLVPPMDRHLVDWYKPITGKHALGEAWGPLLRAMREDNLDPERRFVHAVAISAVEAEVRPLRDPTQMRGLSLLRATDIAIWMGSR